MFELLLYLIIVIETFCCPQNSSISSDSSAILESEILNNDTKNNLSSLHKYAQFSPVQLQKFFLWLIKLFY